MGDSGASSAPDAATLLRLAHMRDSLVGLSFFYRTTDANSIFLSAPKPASWSRKYCIGSAVLQSETAMGACARNLLLE